MPNILCPHCRRPVITNVYGRIPTHADLRTGCRSICDASGRFPEHCEPAPDPGGPSAPLSAPRSWHREEAMS
jgi:hypothetical protein